MTRLLGLLHGFPDGDGWIELVRGEPPVRSTIDRTRLSRATRWLTALRGEYRAFVDDIVDDAEPWLAAVARRLEALKPLVHEGVRVPDDVDTALVWSFSDEAALARARRFVVAHAEALATRPRVEAVRLALMASEQPVAAATWLTILGIPTVPSSAAHHHRRNELAAECRTDLRPTVQPLPRPEAPLADTFASGAQADLVAHAPLLRALQPALELAAATWAETVALHDALLARLALAELPTEALRQRARALAAADVPVDGAKLGEALAALVGSELVTAMSESALALTIPDRARLFVHWWRLTETRPTAFVLAVVRALGRHLQRGRGVAVWRRASTRDHTYNTPESALPDVVAPAFLDRFYEVLELVPDDTLDDEVIVSLVAIDAERATARTRRLVAAPGCPRWSGKHALELAHALASDDAQRFASIVLALPVQHEDELVGAAKLLLDAGVSPLGVQALLVEDQGRLVRLGRSRELARRMKTPLAAVRAAAIDWDPIDPHAGLAAELAWLVAHDGPAARVAALRERLATPAVLTPAQRAREDVRRARHVARATADAMQVVADAAVRGVCVAVLGAEPEWLPEHLELVSHVTALKPPYRELALELLRRRAGPEPWQLDLHPKNVAFLERLRPHVRDLDPWVQGMSWPLEGGRRAAIERDVLSVLRMGQPFGTCLTPGHCNFFSAVVNAADINKRVLFVRDARGLVVGRCLLAVTAQGGLVPHAIYGSADEAAVQGCIRDLAERVGLTLVARGTIEPLVAPGWYDDGPVAITTELGKRLDEALLAKAFDGEQVTALFHGRPEELWLPLVLDSHGASRPAVLQWLRPRLLAADLSDVDRLRAARAYHGCDDAAAADQLLRPAALRLVAATIDRHEGIEELLGAAAVATDPGRFLRLMRAHARKCEYVDTRWMSRCLAALGRARQAEAILRT